MDPLTGVLVGGGLTLLGTIVSQWWTSRRDADRHERERGERREREVATVRADWAAALMDGHMAAIGYLQIWKYLVTRRDPEVPEEIRKRGADLRDIRDRVRGATARLLVIDRDKVVRAMAHAMTTSVEVTLPNDPAPADVEKIAQAENDRLTSLYLAFLSFMDVLANVADATTRDEALRRFVESSHLPTAVKQRLLAVMDARDAIVPAAGAR